MIRKTSSLLAAFVLPAFLFFTASCSDDDDPAPVDLNTITNLPGTVSLTADQVTNTATLKFTALSDWEASSNENPQWFTFEPKKGTAGEVTINITAPYNEGVAKTGKLTIKHGTNTYSVNINQTVGKPDVAVWDETNRTNLLQTSFAPDPYNATEEHPSTFILKLTSKKDYATLEDAPFEIFTFYTDEANHHFEAVDSLVEWVEFKIAENSPAASAGKEILLTVKPHEQFDSTVVVDEHQVSRTTYFMNKRYVYITIVPKGTQRNDMFADGSLKEEYKGITIEQLPYTADIKASDATVIWALMFDNFSPVMGVKVNPVIIEVNNINFKQLNYSLNYDANSHGRDFITVTITENNEVSILLDKAKIEKNPEQTSEGWTYIANISLKVYRGDDLEPLDLKHLRSISVSAMRMM